MQKPITRRGYLKSTVAAAGAVSLLGVAAPVRGRGLNEKLRVGFLGTGGRCNAHITAVMKMQNEGKPVEAAAVCDVYTLNRDRAGQRIAKGVGTEPFKTGDYREIIGRDDVDVVCIATPDHWHAKMTIDGLEAGKHVYCEKPMTHTTQESQDVVAAWKRSGRIMQVGTNGAADPKLKAVNRFIREGHVGKVVQVQGGVYRNSGMGQWRYYKIEKEMTPKNVDWQTFLGREFDLSPDMPFDRAVYKQWRCYWPFGAGLFTDLFVHAMTYLLIAVGVRYPRRVTAGGGIFLEYDGRDVPDTVTMVADYDEGLQIVLCSSMCSQDWPISTCIRGHHGTVVYSASKKSGTWPEKIRVWAMDSWGLGDYSGPGFDFFPERPQVTRTSKPEPRHVSVPELKDSTYAHWENFLEAIAENDPLACNTTPELGAAAVVTVNMGAESYRQGKVFEWDAQNGKAVEGSAAYAQMWEGMSQSRSAPRHIPGWTPYDSDAMFSRQVPNEYQAMEGPWTDGETDPGK